MREPFLALLGAGASIDAGLPSAFDLTEVVYNELNESQLKSHTRLFGYIVAKLQAAKAIQGESPFSKINIEDAYDVLLKFVNRDTDHLSDFVSSWDPVLDKLRPKFDEHQFSNALMAFFCKYKKS